MLQKDIESLVEKTEFDDADRALFAEFREAGAGGRGFVVKLIDQYLAESTQLMASLKEAIEHRDPVALRVAAHSLKGASSTVGATRMAGICEGLERLARKTTCDGAPILVVALGDELTRVRDALHVEQGIGQ